ncbi:MAG: MerR family transcriptional regulator [Clostridium sp.]|nr:MerR family transcriptional regulator [Bacteroides sp.]MCM1198307.1 MerR family transcriptional regulator [Clostridium sp.]
MEKLYYTIGEVAAILGENVSLVRFWSDSFPRFIHPKRNAKGNRMFTAQDVEVFKQIHFLVRHCGLTLEGAARKLQGDAAAVGQAVKILESLKGIRSQLEGIRKSL